MNKYMSPYKYRIHLYVTFKDLFPEEPEINVKDILSHYSRKSLINVALALDTYYGEGEFEKCIHFFSERNKGQYQEIMRRFHVFKSQSIYPNTDFFFCSFISGLELLRYTYSMPEKISDDESYSKFEWNLFRAILQINQQTICKFHAVEGIKKYELIYLNNLCYVDLGKDLKELAIQQYVYAYHFFKYLENSNIQNKNLLNAFEIHYGTSWKRYVLTLISARTISIKHAGRLEKTLECDIDNLMEKSVFDHLKLDTSKEMKYASSSKEDREGNSDYRYFRQSPIIDDGDSYILYSSPLFLGKVYNSLYFDLPKINKEILEKQNRVSSIKDLITTDFVQNTLLYGYIKESIHSGYEMYTEARMEALYVKKENELGAPDLVLISHRHAILFECKDIRLNGWVKEQKDYNLIMQELKEKIIGFGSDDHKGVGQLTGHLNNIRNNNFHWASIGSGKKVYPVLVLSDPNVNQEGLNGIIWNSYLKSLENKTIRRLAANRPLIVMTPMTLIKHAKRFRQKGFAYYFEKYNRYMAKHRQYELSFEHFMNSYRFDRKDLITKIIKELRDS